MRSQMTTVAALAASSLGLLPAPATPAARGAVGQVTILHVNDSHGRFATNIAPADPEQMVGGLVQTTGIEWTADLTRPIGRRIRAVTIDGDPIQEDLHYLIATHSGMLRGLHRYDIFKQGKDESVADRTLSDLVESNLRDSSEASLPPRGNIQLIRPGGGG